MFRKIMIYAASFAAACGLNACGQQGLPPAEGSKTGFALSFFKQVNKSSKGSENILENIILSTKFLENRKRNYYN